MSNEAQVPAHVLEKSQEEVTRIFARAGLAVRWTETAPRVTVQIVPQVLGYARAGSPVMGVAHRTPNGSKAQMFFRQVQDFAAPIEVDLGHDARACDRPRNRPPAPARRTHIRQPA